MGEIRKQATDTEEENTLFHYCIYQPFFTCERAVSYEEQGCDDTGPSVKETEQDVESAQWAALQRTTAAAVNETLTPGRVEFQ